MATKTSITKLPPIKEDVGALKMRIADVIADQLYLKEFN
jgi:hypothetical protein